MLPAWTVHGLTAHLTSVAIRFVEIGHPLQQDGKIDFELKDATRAAVMNDATQQDVDARRDHTLQTILDEWDGALPRALAVLGGDEPLPPGAPETVKYAVVGDMAIHLHDARGALGLPGDRDIAAAQFAYESWMLLLGSRVREFGLPALQIRGRVVGDGPPAAVVDADWYEVLRALSGRRSERQIRAMFRTGDPTPYLPVLTTFERPVDDIVE